MFVGYNPINYTYVSYIFHKPVILRSLRLSDMHRTQEGVSVPWNSLFVLTQDQGSHLSTLVERTSFGLGLREKLQDTAVVFPSNVGFSCRCSSHCGRSRSSVTVTRWLFGVQSEENCESGDRIWT